MQAARLKFLEEQAVLEKQKLSAEIDIKLSREKEAAADAEVEAVVYEQFETGSVCDSLDIKKERVEKKRSF